MARAKPATYVITIKGNSVGFERAMEGIKKASKSARKTFRQWLPTIKRVTAALGALAVAGVGFGVKLAADTEAATVAFEQLLGSAGAARNLIADLQQFAATTPFRLVELREAAQALAGVGTAGNEIIPMLRMIGDVSAGVQKPIDQITAVLVRMTAMGRVGLEEINRLLDANVPILAELSAKFGTTTEEMRKMISAGKIGLGDVIEAFKTMTGEGGRFEGMMTRLSQTAVGQFSTLRDNVDALAESIGAKLLPALNEILPVLIEAVQAFSQFSSRDTQAIWRDIASYFRYLIDAGKALLAVFRLQQASLVAVVALVTRLVKLFQQLRLAAAQTGLFGLDEEAARRAVQTWDEATKSLEADINRMVGEAVTLWESIGKPAQDVKKAAEEAATVTMTEFKRAFGEVREDWTKLGRDLFGTAGRVGQALKQVAGSVVDEMEAGVAEVVQRTNLGRLEFAPAAVRGTVAYSQAVRRSPQVTMLAELQKTNKRQLAEQTRTADATEKTERTIAGLFKKVGVLDIGIL